MYFAVLKSTNGGSVRYLYRDFHASRDSTAIAAMHQVVAEADRGETRELLFVRCAGRVIYNG